MAGAMGGFLAGSIVAKMVLDKTGWNSSVSSIQGDVKKLQVQTGTLGESVSAMAKTWGLAGIAIVGTIGSMIMKNADYMDSLDEMSTRTGVSVEDLSSYKLVLDASGASLDSFAFGMKTLAGKMADARNGNVAATRSFNDLGIAFRNADGSLRPLNDVFLDMADRFKTMGDTPERAALAVDMLGRAGMNLIPTLDLGRAGIKQFTDRAKELGLVVSGEAAKSASDFKDRVGELQGALDGAIQKIVIQLLPALTDMVTKLVPVVQKLMDFLDKTKILQTEVDVFAFKIGLLTDAFDIFCSGLGNIQYILPGIIPNFADIGKKAEEAGDGVGFFTQKLRDMVDPISNAGTQLNLLHDKFNVQTIDDYENKIKDISNTLEHYRGVLPIPEQKRLTEELENARMALLPLLPPFAGLDKICWDMGFISMPPLNKEFKEGQTFIRLWYDEVKKANVEIRETPDALLEARNAAWAFTHVPIDGWVSNWVPGIDEVNAKLGDLYLEMDFSKQVWDNFLQNAATGVAGVVLECFKIPKGLDDALGELPPLIEGIFKTLYNSFASMVGDLITKWVKKFLLDALIGGTADAAMKATKSLVGIGESVMKTTGDVAGAAAKTATGAISGVATSLVNTISGVVTAVASVLALFKKDSNKDITFWLKPISERMQEIRDYLFIVLEGQHLGYMHDIMVDDNKCIWDLVYKGQSIIDILGDSNAVLHGILDKTGHAQAGAFVMSPTLMAVGEQAPRIPEIILPEPVYERNLQIAAAMGGGQPSRPIELYINGEPVKFPMRENMRKIAIDLIPYMTKNEQLKIHPRSVRAF